MTDTTENSIDLRTLETLLTWQENRGVLGPPELDTFLQLLSEARHGEGRTYRFLDCGPSYGTSGEFYFYLDRDARTETGWPEETTVRTSEGNLNVEGAIWMQCYGPDWFIPGGRNMKLDDVRRLSEFFKKRSGGAEPEPTAVAPTEVEQPVKKKRFWQK
jgi:hypothetical protein